MSNVETLFAQIASADPNGGKGIYLPKGLYKVRIQRAFMKTIRDGSTPLIVDYEVIESAHPEHPPGSNRNWYVGMGTPDEQKMGMADIKSFLLAATGIDYRAPGAKEAIDRAAPSLWRAMVSDANPLSGLEMGLEMVPYLAKKTQKTINLHKWLPGPSPLSVESIVSRATGSAVNALQWQPNEANTRAVAPPQPPHATRHPLAGKVSDDGKWVLSDAGTWIAK